MSRTDAQRVHIARTIDQLIDGQIPGPLTVVRLAEAVGLKRWILTHRHPDLICDFQQRAAEVNRDNPEILKLRQRVAQLDALNKQVRARVRELDDLAGRYAQVINELTAQQTQHARPAGRRDPASRPPNLTAARHPSGCDQHAPHNTRYRAENQRNT